MIEDKKILLKIREIIYVYFSNLGILNFIVVVWVCMWMILMLEIEEIGKFLNFGV